MRSTSRQADAPADEGQLLSWLADRLRAAYPQKAHDDFSIQHHCVTILFHGTGLNVDVVPVIYEGEADDIGYLITKDTGARVRTSVTQHLKFIRARKDAQPLHFAQTVRLVKWWVRQLKQQDEDFRFKSFMVELLCAHLADEGQSFADYPAAVEAVLAYIVRTGLEEPITFADFDEPDATPTSRLGDHRSGQPREQRCRELLACAARRHRHRCPRRSRRRAGSPVRDHQGTRRRVLAVPARTPLSPMSTTTTSTFTRTNARYLASKIAADLRQLRSFYGKPTSSRSTTSMTNSSRCSLAAMSRATKRGSARHGKRVVSERYTVSSSGLAADERAGGIYARADISGASWFTFMTYSNAWWNLSDAARTAIKDSVPIDRTPGDRAHRRQRLLGERSQLRQRRHVDQPQRVPARMTDTIDLFDEPKSFPIRRPSAATARSSDSTT